MRKQTPIVTLLTDFGTEDGYVGALKGILLREISDVKIVDISHQIDPFDVHQAAFTLINYADYFPPGTIHCIVVDPGVGSKRKALVINTINYYFVGPDNGVFSFIYQFNKFQARAVLEEKFGKEICPTFHGRDIFIPAVIRLLKEESLEKFTIPVEHLSSFYKAHKLGSRGDHLLEVIHVDHFGNLILNFSKNEWQDLGSPLNLKIRMRGGFECGIKRTFADSNEGQITALWDSSGFLQIAQNLGNAAKTLQMGRGDEVILSKNIN